MENLNKKNFWNELQEKYPKGMKVFCDWIDEYKKKNNWNLLFNSDSEYQNAEGKNAPAPKYHDLPIAFQMGMWTEFVREKNFGKSFEDYLPTLRDDISESIRLMHQEAIV